MPHKGVVVILENDREIFKEMESGLTALGYNCVRVRFPGADVSDVVNHVPEAILIGLTEWDDDRLDICELLMEKRTLAMDIPVIAVFSEDTLRKVPYKFDFANTIIYPYEPDELDFRLSRTIYQYRQRTNQGIIVVGGYFYFIDGVRGQSKERAYISNVQRV
jgi:DNA-binding response OmpR family regulator